MSAKEIINKVKKKISKKLFLASENRRYIRQPALVYSFPPEPLSPDSLLIIATVFNRSELIPLQHTFLKKNLKDPFVYFIADNSNKEECIVANEAYCRLHHISYVRLPKNPYSGIDGSLSHGLAMNWLYANIVQKLKPLYFAFIDHDIFPVEPVHMIPRIQANGAYGLLQQKDKTGRSWYLWAGFQFFSSSWTDEKAMNFLPVAHFDTAGGNYPNFQMVNKKNMVQSYTSIPVPGYEFMEVQRIAEWAHMAESYVDERFPLKMDYITKLFGGI